MPCIEPSQLHANVESLFLSARLSHPVSFAQNTTELYQEAEVWPGNFHQGPGILGYTDLGVLSSEFLSLCYYCCDIFPWLTGLLSPH